MKPVERSIYSRERKDGSLAYYVRFTRDGRRTCKVIGTLEQAPAWRDTWKANSAIFNPPAFDYATEKQEAVEVLYKNQRGRCAICQRKPKRLACSAASSGRSQSSSSIPVARLNARV